MNKTVFITGSSGFIGSNLAKRILTTEPDTKVIGLDNMNDYYDIRIKEARLAELQKFENYIFIKGNLADKALINSIFEQYHPDIVVNLGAQAGVRYSITNPDAYIESNMIGFYNILEACRHYPVEHLVYASSSSVYGSNKKVPYSTDDKVDNPVSLYAATKKSNELMAHAYSKLYNIPSTGLRFFTVYGPAGRPDMAYFGFTNKLVNGETIKIFNYGNCKRDFTYLLQPLSDAVRAVFLHVLHQRVVVILTHRRRAVLHGFAAARKVRNNILRSGPSCVVVIQTEDDFADSREILQKRIQCRIVRAAQRQIMDTAPWPRVLHELRFCEKHLGDAIERELLGLTAVKVVKLHGCFSQKCALE